jgi:phytoene dehydrogenase-like protein
MMKKAVVVGAGLSGLTAARRLKRRGWSVVVVEAQSRVGGRIQSDVVEGFILDHGFQVYLTAYATAGGELELESLALKKLPAGALIRRHRRFWRWADPLRSNWVDCLPHLIGTLRAPIGSFVDKYRLWEFRRRMLKATESQLAAAPESSSRQRLEAWGFSSEMIDAFFRPFFGGIFLDPDLVTSSRRMEFVFKAFSEGWAALPAQGMQAIPEQVAADLGGDIRLATPALRVEPGCVILANGERLIAPHIIVATDRVAAHRLLGVELPGGCADQATLCLYFEAPNPPWCEATLVLNGDPCGLINNLCFPSFAQPSYAPPGRVLLSVSTVGIPPGETQDTVERVGQELREWFGQRVDGWRFLRAYRIPHALPDQSPQALKASRRLDRDGIHCCGDYLEIASIEGTIGSGHQAADEVIRAESI